MSNPPPKPPGLHTIVQYTIVSTTSDGGENTVPRTETTKALLQPHMTVDAFLTTIDRLIASHYPGYVREEPSEVVYYPPMVANSHPSEEEAISIDKGTTICNVPAIAKRREITIASNSGSVDEFDRPYIIASSSPICLVIRRRRGSLLLAPSSQSLHQSSTSSLSRKAAEPKLQLPQDPTDAADLLIADELARIQEGRQSSSPHRHWSGSLSKPTSSETVLDALSTEERILQTRLAAVQERAIAIKSKKATLVAQKAALQGELKRATAGFEEAGGEENQRRKERLEEEVEGLRTEIAVQRQRESEMVTKAADEMATSPSPRRSGGGGGVASPGSPYDPLFSPGAKGKATAAAPNNATTTTAGKYAVANLSSDHEGAESPQHYKSHPSSHVNHHPRHPPATHEHRMDDTPRHHQDYTYGDGGVAEDFGDEDHLGSGPPPPLPPREGYTSTAATSHQAAVDEHQQPSPSDNHYAASPPSGAVVGSRYRSEVDQERAGRFGGGGGMGTSRYQQHASLVPSSDPYQLQQAAAPPTNYESHFDANTVDETSWLNPVLRKEVDSALSQVLPIPKYLQETNNNNMSSPPPPTPHVQMMNSPPQAGYNSGGATTIPTPFPRVPTMMSGGSPGSLTTSLSAYLYQMEGGSPQGLRKDLIARLGSRQYTNSNNNSGLGGSSSPSGGRGGYQPPQHIAPQRHLYGEPKSNATNDDDDRDDHNYGHHQADMHAASPPPQQQQQASSPQYQQSKYFQSTGNHHYHQHQAPSSSPFSTSTPAKGGGGYDDHVEDQTPPQPQYRRPSYGALRGGVGGGGAQSFGSGTMRLNTNINTQGGGEGGGGTTSSSYYPAAGRVGNAAGRVVPNFDESP